MRANWSKYLFNEASSMRLRDRYAPQNNSRKRQSSSKRALRPKGASALPYLMVRSMSSCARVKAPSARLSFPASKALSTREVSLPMLAICCGNVKEAHRPFSREACCIYPIMNCSTILSIAALASGSDTSREGFPCQERILIRICMTIRFDKDTKK